MENTIKNLFEQLDSREKKSKLMNYINGAVKEVNTQEIFNILPANIVLNMTSGDSKSRTNAMIDIALRLGGKLVDADDAKISEGRVVYYYKVKNNHRFVNCICLGLINDIGKIYAEARQSYTANQTVYIVIALSDNNGDFELYKNIDGIYDNYRVVVKALGFSAPEAVLQKAESADIGSVKQTSAEVYICPNCGKKINDSEAAFCDDCGAKLYKSKVSSSPASRSAAASLQFPQTPREAYRESGAVYNPKPAATPPAPITHAAPIAPTAPAAFAAPADRGKLISKSEINSNDFVSFYDDCLEFKGRTIRYSDIALFSTDGTTTTSTTFIIFTSDFSGNFKFTLFSGEKVKVKIRGASLWGMGTTKRSEKRYEEMFPKMYATVSKAMAVEMLKKIHSGKTVHISVLSISETEARVTQRHGKIVVINKSNYGSTVITGGNCVCGDKRGNSLFLLPISNVDNITLIPWILNSLFK